MIYYSLSNPKQRVGFGDAVLQGQSPDGGLYFPEKIPVFNKLFSKTLNSRAIGDIATEILWEYVKEDTKQIITREKLHNIVFRTLSFPIHIGKISPSISCLELFHGPTLAFKDVGARFLSLCLSELTQNIEKKTIVLVATSGDTGGAVAHAFDDIKDIDVVILYPEGKVSSLQEKQLCPNSRNVHSLRIKGSFDDCQALVKQAFRDEHLKKKIYLTSANSINIARWLSQQIYFVSAFRDWSTMQEKDALSPHIFLAPRGDTLPNICVPSGNFGNLCAGMLANKSGLPVKHFIAACNANDVVPQYLNGNQPYQTKPAIVTLSNAMDIGAPNNFVRVEKLFDNNKRVLKNNLSAYSISDEKTLETIKKVFEKYNYLLDPHTAVAYHAAEQHQEKTKDPTPTIILGTAHPIKFNKTIGKALDKSLTASFWENLPQSKNINLKNILNDKVNSIPLDKDYNTFKHWIIKNL